MTKFWHPFSNMSVVREHEVVFVSGRGCELTDSDGKRYLDATAGLWYCNVGYGRERIADAIREQAARLASCTCFEVFASDRTLELAERVARMAPVRDSVVFFTSGGSDSIDTAAKVARRYWAEVGAQKKRVVIARERSYHGMNAYGTALAGIPQNRQFFDGLIPDTTFVPAMDPGALKTEIERLDGRVAAFIAEPVLGPGGVFPPTDGYLREVSRICVEADVLLIADEVITGFGRTGVMFGSERYGIEPDILVLAKGITSGYQPLGAVVFSGRIAEPFWSPGSEAVLRHGYTYSGHATACAAALANLDILEEESLVARVEEIEGEFATVMRSLEGLSQISEVRVSGLMAGVQISSDAVSKDPEFVSRAAEASRSRGVITRRLAGNALQVSPAFIVTREQMEQIASTLSEAITLVETNIPQATPLVCSRSSRRGDV